MPSVASSSCIVTHSSPMSPPTSLKPAKEVPAAFQGWSCRERALLERSCHRNSRPTSRDRTAMLFLSPLLTSRHRTDTRSLASRVRLRDVPIHRERVRNLISSWRAVRTKCPKSSFVVTSSSNFAMSSSSIGSSPCRVKFGPTEHTSIVPSTCDCVLRPLKTANNNTS